ncbi:glycoside hydrolase family 18 protein [Corynascus similis CBS 632.67]
MRFILPLVASLPWAVTATALELQPNRTHPELPRLMLYFQTTHDAAGRPISLLPLVHKQHIALTHLIVAAFHINPNGTIHLNDHHPSHPRYSTLWTETRILQSSFTNTSDGSGGVKILGMLGGAAPGSFAANTLDAAADGDGDDDDTETAGPAAAFERSYALLRETVRAHKLDGVDLDVEEPMTLRGIVRLVRRLRADFGPRFVISLAPVATALVGRQERRGRWGNNLSGFDYGVLERAVGEEVAFYNAQFYNGFGGMGDTRLFDAIVAEGWEPERIVIGQLTSPEHGGGFVKHGQFGRTVKALRRRYGEIGGVVGWEYFNAVPGGINEPWKWAESMTKILRPEKKPILHITKKMAERLTRAWMVSAAEGRGSRFMTAERWIEPEPNVDYLAMVNAEE